MKSKQITIQMLPLLMAGSLLILISTYILVSPTGFYASTGILVDGNVNMLNEFKVSAGFLFAAGVYIFVATFVSRFRDSAALLATMIYLSYAGSRYVSMLVDGLPASELVQAAVLETVVGLTCLRLLLKDRLNPVGVA